jgi:hypothetical protein
MWPIAPTAARTLLARFTERQLPAGAPLDDDQLLERYPLWFRAAVITLVGQATLPATDVDFLRDHRGAWLPLRDLMVLVRPTSQDTILDPTRRNDLDDRDGTIVAQSSTVGRFLVEREGHGVIGRLARGYLAGRSLQEMVAEFKSSPKTLAELDQRWRSWIESREH